MNQDVVAGGGARARSSAPGDEAQVATIVAEMRDYVQLRWPAYYPGRTGSAPVITITPRHFGFSLILQVDLAFPGGESERFMIKIRRQQKHGTFVREELSDRILELSRAEYREHLKAYDFFARQPDGLSVVRPLDFLESHNAFFVEHARGRDLSKVVRDGSPLATEALRRCGRWWHLFHHELHDARERAWDPEATSLAMERRFRKLTAIGAPDDALSVLRQEIAGAATRVAPAPVPVGFVHGDCKLRHVWATETGIQVLDFGNAKVGDAWIDPAALVVELSLYSLWTSRLDSAPKVADMRTLLNAYFGGPPPPAFALHVVDCLLKKWHRRLRKWGPGAGLTRLHRSLKTTGLDKGLERLYIDRWFIGQIRAWLALAEGDAPAWLRPVLEPPCP
jgi:hypothetical protein